MKNGSRMDISEAKRSKCLKLLIIFLVLGGRGDIERQPACLGTNNETCFPTIHSGEARCNIEPLRGFFVFIFIFTFYYNNNIHN